MQHICNALLHGTSISLEEEGIDKDTTLLELTEMQQDVILQDNAIERLSNASEALEALLLLPANDSTYQISHESILLTLGMEADEETATPEKSKGVLRSIMDGISKFFKKLWEMIKGFFGKIKSFFTGQNKKIDATIAEIKDGAAAEDTRSAVGGKTEGNNNAATGNSEDSARLQLHKLSIKVPALFNVKGGVVPDSLDSVLKQIEEVVSFGKAVVEQIERTHSLYDKVVVDLKGAAKAVEGAKFDSAVNAAINKLNQHSIVESVFKHKGIMAGGLKVEVATEHGATRISVESAPLGEVVDIDVERKAVVAFLESLKKVNESYVSDVASRADRLSTMTNRLIDIFDKTIEEVIASGLQNRISAFRRVSQVLITIMRGDTQALMRTSQMTAKLVVAATNMAAPRTHALVQNKH